MMQSLFALPIGVLLVALLFFGLYWLTSIESKQGAFMAALIALFTLGLYSVFNWPGADVLAMYVAVLSVTAYLLGIIAHVWEKKKVEGDKANGWFHWGPTVIVCFFLALFSADSVFVMVSKDGLSGKLAQKLLPSKKDASQVSSMFPGVVSRNYQKKEMLYNDFQQQMREQDQRGWQVRKGWLGSVYVDQPSTFQVQIDDRAGLPITDAQIEGVYMRPSNMQQDTVFSMIEKTPGIYQAQITLPEPGAWSLALTITKDDLRHEVFGRTRLTAQPIE